MKEMQEIINLFALREDNTCSLNNKFLYSDSEPKIYKNLTSAKSIKAASAEIIKQYFNTSKEPCILNEFNSTQYRLLQMICKGLIEANKRSPKLSFLCEVYILEICANHFVLLEGLVSVVDSHKEMDEAEKQRLKADPTVKKQFQSLTLAMLNQMYCWLGNQMLGLINKTETNKFFEKTPNFIIPSFNKIELLDEESRCKAKTFLSLVSKHLHDSRNFIISSRMEAFVGYSQLVLLYLCKFKKLSEVKKNESVFNHSHTCSEKGDLEEEHEHSDLPTSLLCKRILEIKQTDVSSIPPSKNRRRIHSEYIHVLRTNSTKNIRRKESINQTAELLAEPESSFYCGFCHRKVMGLFWACSKCLHGGHIYHMKNWFSQNTKCATCFGCECKS